MSEFNWDAFLQMLKGKEGICESAFRTIKKAVAVGKGETPIPYIPRAGEIYKKNGTYAMLVDDSCQEPILVGLDGTCISSFTDYSEDLVEELTDDGWEKVAISLQELYSQESPK